MLGREVEIAGAELLDDPFNLVHGSPSTRRKAAVVVDQAFRSLRLMRVAQVPKMPLARP
jgi:hypothetical protein